MASLDLIRTITIKAQQQGVDATSAAVGGLSNTVDTSGKRALSVEKNFAALERRFIAGAKEIQEFEKIQRMLNLAVGQFPQLLDQANRILDAAATKLLGASNATSKLTAAMSENVMASKAMTAGMTAAGQAADKTANSVKIAGEVSAAASKQIVAGMSSIGAKALESSVATEKLTAGLSQAGKDAAATKPFDRLIQGMTDATNASKNMITGMSAVGTEAAKTGQSTNKFGDATKGARYEMLNLSRQLQDVVVSAQSGQGIFTILVQQGSQIADIFQTAAASGRNFGASLLRLITPLSVTVTSVLALGTAAVVAAFQWTQAQKAIQQSLLGIGRASGATVSDINEIAAAAKELSTSEGGQVASIFASTGKIGVSVMKELVNATKDASRVMGVDLDEAAKILAKDFANLETGVDDLNGRLGSFSAAAAENISLLIKQGDRLGAQKAALEGLKSGLEGVNNVVSNSARGWNVFTNAISDAWSKLGEFVAKAAGLGPALDLKTQEAALKTQIARVSERLSLPLDPKTFEMVNAQVGLLTNKLIEVQTEMANTAKKANETAANIASAFQKKQIDVAMPEIIKQKDADAAVKAMEDIVEGLLSGRIAADDLGRSLTQAVAALAILKAQAGDVESAFKSASDTLAIAAKAAVAVSPGAKAEVAKLQQMNSLKGTSIGLSERQALADQAAANSLSKFATDQGEAAKARELSAQQSLETSQKELEVFGQTAVKQKEQLLNLQSRHQLEQAALAAGLGAQGFDKAELKKLEAINKTNAALLVQKDIMQQIAQEVGNFINTFVSGMVEGKSAVESLAASMKGLGAAITAAASKKIGESIVGGAGDFVQGITGLAGLGGTAGLAIGAGVSLIAGLFDQSKKQAEQKAAAEAAASAMNQANEALKSVTDSFMALTAAAEGAVTSTLKNAQQQFEQLKNAADSARAAALIIVNTPGNTPAVMAQANANIAAANQAVLDATQRLADFNLRTINDALDSFVSVDLSPMAQGLKDLHDKAKDLTEALILTGRSADEAAELVNERLTKSLAMLADKINNDLVRKINEATGAGWINSMTDLVTEISDAALGGGDPDLIAEFLRATVQSLIDSNKLIGESFAYVLQIFPDLEGSIHEFSEEAVAAANAVDNAADILKAAADRLAALEDRAFAATNRGDDLASQLARFDHEAQKQRAAEIEAGGQNIARLEEVLALERMNIIDDYNAEILKQQQDAADKLAEEQRRAEQERFDTIKKANEDIINYLNGLLTSNLSPLSAKAQLDQARRLYEAQLALAQSGDVTALQNITKSADTLLNASKAFYGSSAGYQRDFTAVQGQLGSLAGGNTGLNPANDNVAAISATGFANVTMLLQRLVELAGGNSNLVAENTDAINAQTAAIITETRFSDRKATG